MCIFVAWEFVLITNINSTVLESYLFNLKRLVRTLKKDGTLSDTFTLE